LAFAEGEKVLENLVLVEVRISCPYRSLVEAHHSLELLQAVLESHAHLRALRTLVVGAGIGSAGALLEIHTAAAVGDEAGDAGAAAGIGVDRDHLGNGHPVAGFAKTEVAVAVFAVVWAVTVSLGLS
jgi:hypothetical protein